METFLAVDAAMVIDKILRHDRSDLPVAALVQMLSRQYDVIGKEGAGFQAEPPSYEMLALARHLFAGVGSDHAIELLQDCSGTPSGLAFTTDLIRDLGKPVSNVDVPHWLPEAQSVAARAIETRIRALSPKAPDDEIERTLRCIWALRDFRDSDHVKGLLWDLVEGDKGWQVAMFVALLVPIGYGSDGTWMIDRHYLPAEHIEELLGFERVAAALEGAGEGMEPPNLLQRYEVRPTLSERMASVYADFPSLADALKAAKASE
jgi:hypothetical protein